MVFQPKLLEHGLEWLADGYRHRLFAAEEYREPEKVHRDGGDSFALVPEDDAKSFISLRINTPTELANTRRVRSASHVRLQNKYETPQCWTEDSGDQTPERPASAIPSSTIPPRPKFQRRVKSAGVERQKALTELRKGFMLVNKLYEDKYRRQNINLHPASPAPDYRYFDRHSRCLDYDHMHGDLFRERPSTACGYYDPCPGRARPISATSKASQRSGRTSPDTTKQPKRYTNYHRPRTAPPMRGDGKPLPRANYLFRGRTPKFCNIVSQMQIHARESSSRPTTPHQDSEFDDQDYLQRTFDANLIGRLRRNSADSIADEIVDEILSEIPPTKKVLSPRIPADIVEPEPDIDEDVPKKSGGTEGRPTSPSSIIDQDETPEKEEVKVCEQVIEIPVENDIEDPPIRAPVVVVEYETKGISRVSFLLKNKGKNTLSTPKKVIAKPPEITDKIEKDLTDKIPPVVIPSDNDNFNDASARDTPKQPPPTPETVIVPKLPETPPPPTRRKCQTKKKKSNDKRPKKREMKKEEEPPKEEAPPPPPPPPPEEEKVEEQKEIKVDLGLPDLPTYQKEEKQRQNKEQRKPERHLLVKTHEEKIPGPKELLEELQNNKHYEFSLEDLPPDDTPKKMSKSLPEFRGRLALSQRSARFELPMDMKELETISAKDYIMQYCRISERRQRLYDKKFFEHKDKINNVIPFEKLEKAMKEVLVDTITTENFKDMVDLLDIQKDAKINSEFFGALCALGERVLYPKFVTQETVDIAEYKREMIECADFCALDWKLHGVNVNPKTYKLLKQLS